MRDRLIALALKALLRGLSWLSFGSLQHLGKIVGDSTYACGGALRQVTSLNLEVCFPEMSEAERDGLVRESLRHTGRFAAEFGILWRQGDQRWKDLIRTVDGIDAIDEAQRVGKGVLVLVPHFGNWEVLNLYLGARYGLTALYDPPQMSAFDSITRNARMRTGSSLVPINTKGVRALYVALRQGRVAAILPDQVPSAGTGAYVPFFGRAALTMTLAQRLADRLQPRLILGHARRLPSGAGFSLGFEVLSEMESLKEPKLVLGAMNAAIERLVRTGPAQYQWEYKRFKKPPTPHERIY